MPDSLCYRKSRFQVSDYATTQANGRQTRDFPQPDFWIDSQNLRVELEHPTYTISKFRIETIDRSEFSGSSERHTNWGQLGQNC
jgi:hypothetical protein